MKTLKNKNGFTLIELLAVIVVLAIVTVLATTTLLPLMNKAVKKSFIDEANAAKTTAGDIMTLISLDSFKKSTDATAGDFQESDTKVCISVKEMAKQGLFDKDMEYFEGDSPEYEGKVIVTKDDGNTNNYKYKVIMHNGDYMINTDKKIADENVFDYKEDSTVYSCTGTDVGNE